MIRLVAEPTTTIITLEGVGPCRVWRATFPNGRPCELLIAGLRFHDPLALVEFEAELSQLDDRDGRTTLPR